MRQHALSTIAPQLVSFRGYVGAWILNNACSSRVRDDDSLRGQPLTCPLTLLTRVCSLVLGPAPHLKELRRSPWAHVVSKTETAKEFRKRHTAYCGVREVVNAIQRNDLAHSSRGENVGLRVEIRLPRRRLQPRSDSRPEASRMQPVESLEAGLTPLSTLK